MSALYARRKDGRNLLAHIPQTFGHLGNVCRVIISMTNKGVFSDDMVITWRVSQPVHTVELYDKSSDDYKRIPMDEYYANVVAFPELVIMSLPAARSDTEYTPAERIITVQGTVEEVLNSIYEAYQQPATEKEIQFRIKRV